MESVGVLIVFGLAALAGIGALSVEARRSSLWRSVMAAVAERLTLAKADGDSAYGRLDGVPVGVRILRTPRGRAEGLTSAPAGVVAFVASAPAPLELELRPRLLGVVGPRLGLALDLEVGDPAFDHAFVVEGAPADLARALLSPELRERILELRPTRLCVTADGVRIEVGAMAIEAEPLLALLELGRAVAVRLSLVAVEANLVALHAAAQEATRADQGSAPSALVPYRQGGAALVDVELRREAERRQLVVVRRRRSVALVSAVVTWIALVLAFILHDWSVR